MRNAFNGSHLKSKYVFLIYLAIEFFKLTQIY